MEYVSVKKYAQSHGVSERTVRNYCAHGKMPGALLVGKTWCLPEDTSLPPRKNARVFVSPLLRVLREQRASKAKGGIYHRTQIEFAYNSNHMEGSRLTEEQTRYIFETNTIGISNEAVKVDDIIEAANHFRCVDFIIDHVCDPLSESMIKELHRMLKSGTSDAAKSWIIVGEYKRVSNEVGGMDTTHPLKVGSAIRALLKEYRAKKVASFEEILDFHYCFERIHPFQDGNGRVGRLIMFKECLRAGIVPFIITEDLKMFYYRGLREWKRVPGYLSDICLTAQDRYKAALDYFHIKY